MTISFPSIPSNLRVPFVTAEFDSAFAQQGPALLAYRALLIGQKASGGSQPANTLAKVTSADDVVALAGRGSMLHRMARSFFQNNALTEVWIGALDDAGGSAAAAGTITITGTAAEAGVLAVYIAGELVAVPVSAGALQNAIAASVATAATAVKGLPAIVTAASNVVTVTALNKGGAGDDIDLRVNYYDGDVIPAGLTVTVSDMAGGTGTPSLTSLIAALGDTWFHVIAHPYYDSTSLTAIETELASRLGPMRMIDGIAITSAPGTQSTLGTLGGGRNSPSSVIVAQPGKAPLTSPCEFAAAVAGVIAAYGNQDPARPFQTLPVAGVLPPPETDRFTFSERNLNLYDGIATTSVAGGGLVQLERMITTYQQNAAGSPDTAYLDVTTMLTLQYLRYSFRNRMSTRYPRHKLADDGTRFGAGQAVITPLIGRGEAVNWYRDMMDMGLVEDMDGFKANLVVERNSSNPNRLDFLLPPNLVNGLIVTAADIQFRL